MSGMSVIVKTVTRLTAGFLVLFGFYLFMHGHRSHGVGFAGGVIIALAGILFVIAFGKNEAVRRINEMKASLVMNLAFLALLAVSVAGLVLGRALAPAPHAGLFVPLMMVLANAALCLAAAGSLFFIFLNLVSFKGDR